VDSRADTGSQDRETVLGVCLSGGGFRAAFYALGALRYLAEAKLLPRVEAISAVSGGSIAAAMVIDRWESYLAEGADDQAFRHRIDAPFREYVTTQNLRNRWLVRSSTRGLVPSRAGRGAALGATLLESLYDHTRVAELPSRPQVIFTATELNSGRAFRVARDFVGSYDYGYTEPAPPTIQLGTAVAASAAFPLSFTVIRLATDDLGLKAAPRTLSLVDGGVYDNLGLEWFQGREPGRPKSAVRPDFVIVVNASRSLHPTKKTYGPRNALFREFSIQYQQTLNVRIRWLVDKWISEGGRGVYVGITHDPRRYVDARRAPIDPSFFAGSLPSDVVDGLARLRTDLDRFTEEEAALLSYHGYWSLHARLKTFRPDLAVAAPAWHESRYSDMPEAERRELLARLAHGARVKLRR
jgi:NTE family protein